MVLEKEAIRYQDQLLQLFAKSSEGQALQSEGMNPGSAGIALEFGINYLGVTPPQMSLADLNEILFDLFPRKLSASAVNV